MDRRGYLSPTKNSQGAGMLMKLGSYRKTSAACAKSGTLCSSELEVQDSWSRREEGVRDQ